MIRIWNLSTDSFDHYSNSSRREHTCPVLGITTGADAKDGQPLSRNGNCPKDQMTWLQSYQKI